MIVDRPDVLSIFQRQYGIASVQQLLDARVSRSSVDRARKSCVLEDVLPGVYKLAGTELTFRAKCIAALLYFGPDAYLGGKTAAAIHGCRGMGWEVVHVRVRATAHVVSGLPAWIRVRRTAWRLDGDVVTLTDGLRVSTPLRTLFDIASQVNQHRFERIAEDMWHLNLVTPTQADDYLALVRRSGRRGVARFEAWVERTSNRERPAQSGLELDLIDAIVAAGLPEPERQHPLTLPSGELVHIDVAWTHIQFGLEPGHSWWHGGDLQVRKDYARDNACGEIGWFIRRLDEKQCNDRQEAVRVVKSLYESRTATFHPVR